MKEARLPRKRLLPTLVLAGLLGASTAASAQQSSKQIVYVNAIGIVERTETPNTGKVHLSGDLSVGTADYSRGVYDGVSKNLDDIAVMPTLRATFELPDPSGGPLRNLSLTVGSANGLTTNVQQPTDGNVDAWYESNTFVGLGAEMGRNWLLGLTYSVYTTPNGISTTSHRLALVAARSGRWNPLVKLETPIDEGDGVFTKLGVTPTLNLQQGGRPWTIEFPLAVGVGLADFYGPGTDTGGYLSLGVTGSTPLQFMPSDYGNWTFSVGLDVLVRSDDLREAAAPVTDDDTVVPIGTVKLSFVY